MFTAGLFWGIFIVILGILVVIKNFMKIEIPIFKTMIGVFLVMLGIKLLFFRGFHDRPYCFHKQESGGIKEFNPSEGQYKVVFGKNTVDLRDSLIALDKPIEAEVVFGDLVFLIDNKTQVKVNSEVVFGGIENSSEKFINDTIQPKIINMNASVVFGSIKIINPGNEK